LKNTSKELVKGSYTNLIRKLEAPRQSKLCRPVEISMVVHLSRTVEGLLLLQMSNSHLFTFVYVCTHVKDTINIKY